jgi:Capsule assembly protein Wzi
VRPRKFLYFAGLAACVLCPAWGQTISNPPGYAPPPAPAPADSIPGEPAYNKQPPPNAPAAPTPEIAPPPVAPPTAKAPFTGYAAYAPEAPHAPDNLGSTYIPVDSWVYPAMTRLYGLGYVDTMFLSMRPWTRQSVLHMLEKSQDAIMHGGSDEAQEILAAVLTYLRVEAPEGNAVRGSVYGVESLYTRFMGISGPILRDSYHLGQTINNDYGRPYESGFNNVTGFSSVNEKGRFSLYVRAEYQHAPSATGYSFALANQLSMNDFVGPYAPPNAPQDTIPAGPIASQNPFRIVEADLSFFVWGTEISGGKSDAWLGPAQGGSLAWSNNAENIYSFRINRVEPLHIPGVSRILGPVRYDFFYGSLKGHTNPNSPYTHSEMFSFRPTSNFEFGFQRTIIFGGEGHTPVTLHTFLKGFFDISDTTEAEKLSRDDPGARFSDFSLSYRLPFVRNYLSFYLDSISHDDVTPISAPRRASYRTGLYLSQFPKLKKLDMRVEAVSTDPGVSPAHNGQFAYWEVIQVQGYTNKGNIMGDWIGREAKGGQAWLTYHLSGNEWVQFEYLNKKTPSNFIGSLTPGGPGGTTQNSYMATVVKRLGKNIELNGWVQYERWKAPIYKSGLQTDTTAAFQVTWFPSLFTRPKER